MIKKASLCRKKSTCSGKMICSDFTFEQRITGFRAIIKLSPRFLVANSNSGFWNHFTVQRSKILSSKDVILVYRLN